MKEQLELLTYGMAILIGALVLIKLIPQTFPFLRRFRFRRDEHYLEKENEELRSENQRVCNRNYELHNEKYALKSKNKKLKKKLRKK